METVLSHLSCKTLAGVAEHVSLQKLGDKIHTGQAKEEETSILDTSCFRLHIWFTKESKNGDVCKCVIEKGKSPELEQPDELEAEEAENKILFFKHKVEHKEHVKNKK